MMLLTENFMLLLSVSCVFGVAYRMCICPSHGIGKCGVNA